MSLNQATLNGMGEIIGNVVGDVALAVGAIVKVLKQQPGFDTEAFDNGIRELLELPDLSVATRHVLNLTIPDEDV